MATVKDASYITIQGWMRTKLGLKGNELLVYALIYGFSQDGFSKFSGTRRYIAEWCGCSLKTVDNTIASLLAKNLIVKHEKFVNGIRMCDYTANTPDTADRHDNTQNTVDDHTTARHETEPQPASPEPKPKKAGKGHSFDDIIDGYTTDPTTKELIGEWLQNRKATRAAMTDNAIKRNLDTLDKCAAESHMTVNSYLAEIVRRGWKAFYPINSYQRTGYQTQRPQNQPSSCTLTPEDQRKQDEDDAYFLNHCVF